MGRVAQALYDLFSTILGPNTDLQAYLGSMGDVLFQEIDDYVSDGDNGERGWSVLIDLDRAPDKVLPWLAQFIGVSLPPGLTATQQRQQIRDTDGWNRGTVAAIVGAAAPYLTGTKSVILRERFGDPYIFEVITRTSETPNSAAVLAALTAQKPAGLIMIYNVLSGLDYQLLFSGYATYQLAFAGFANYQDLLDNNPGGAGSRKFGDGTFGSGTFG